MINYKYESEVLIIETKTLSFRVDLEFHKKIKMQAIKENKSLQDYIADVLKKDLESKEKK